MFSKLFRRREPEEKTETKREQSQFSLGAMMVEEVLIHAYSKQVKDVAFGPRDGADDSLVFIYHIVGDECQQVGQLPIELWESAVLPVIKERCRPTTEPDSPILSIQPFPDDTGRGVKIRLA